MCREGKGGFFEIISPTGASAAPGNLLFSFRSDQKGSFAELPHSAPFSAIPALVPRPSGFPAGGPGRVMRPAGLRLPGPEGALRRNAGLSCLPYPMIDGPFRALYNGRKKERRIFPMDREYFGRQPGGAAALGAGGPGGGGLCFPPGNAGIPGPPGTGVEERLEIAVLPALV